MFWTTVCVTTEKLEAKEVATLLTGEIVVDPVAEDRSDDVGNGTVGDFGLGRSMVEVVMSLELLWLADSETVLDRFA